MLMKEQIFTSELTCDSVSLGFRLLLATRLVSDVQAKDLANYMLSPAKRQRQRRRWLACLAGPRRSVGVQLM